MARKRTSENEIALSSNTVAPARRKAVAAPRKKHTPASAVAEPVAETAATMQQYQPTHEDIAALAYSYYVARGYQAGSPEEDWLRAERELSLAAEAANA